MGWNGSGRKTEMREMPRAEGRKRPNRLLLWIVGALAVGTVAVVWRIGVRPCADKRETDGPGRDGLVRRMEERPAAHETGKGVRKGPAQDRSARSAALQEQVREYVKKALTNDVNWVTPPLDPDDPDRALHTRQACEIATLLAVQPGERMIPFPFSFMDEDWAEGREDRPDNGNRAFLDALKQFKVAAKESDSEGRIAFKEKFLAAQGEILAAMDEGISVNDSIRAAYEFRVRAYEARSAAIETMREFLQGGDGEEDTLGVLKQINAKFAEDGIKTITAEEIGIEADEEGEHVK